MDFQTYERVGWAKYEEFARAVALILESVIRTDQDLRLQSVTHRAKTTDSLRKKLEDRNLINTERVEEDIKDLAGCRVILYTNSDVNRFMHSGLMHENFEILEAKIHYPSRYRKDNGRYTANHYLVKLRSERTALSEYARFTGMRCEVQIQTILNHAWAETAHNITYKKPPLDGFGSAAFQAIQQRIDNVMDKYLKPAGYEFQKILSDYERLRLGKNLFDEGALDAIINSENNNDRFDALERLAEHVLPYYDDVEAEWPQIVDTLASAMEAARGTPPLPIETPFGAFPGKTATDITAFVADLLKAPRYRYLDIERTFDVLCRLFPGAHIEDERKSLLALAENLAKHELEVWKGYGPAVQSILVSHIKDVPADDLRPLQPLLVAMLGKILEPEITGTSSSSSAVTFSRGTVVASNELAKIRSDAISLLMKIYPLARTDAERRTVLGTLAGATLMPGIDGYSCELVRIVIEESRHVINFYTEIAPSLSWELLQAREHRALHLYRNRRKLPDDMEADPALREARDELLASIRAFRDHINSDRRFVIYKTLVGFESVFPPAWDNDQFNYEEEKAYREERVAELVGEVDDANAEEWFALLTQCAQTESRDLATFPSFGRFLKSLGEAKPHILVAWVDRIDRKLAKFLPDMLDGLMRSNGRRAITIKIEKWVESGQYLGEVAQYLQFSEPFDEGLLQRVLNRSLAAGNDDAVLSALLAAADQHTHPGTLIESVFLPALKHLAAKGDMRWIGLTWLQWRTNSFAADLDADQAKEILSALVPIPQVDINVEPIIASICTRWPEQVIKFFDQRQAVTKSKGVIERYKALPFSVDQLREPLAASKMLITAARRWFDDDPLRFRFLGGHFLAAVFPDFPEDFHGQLTAFVRTGDRRDIAFVLQVLHNYEGKTFIHDLCKQVIARLDEKDELRTEVIAILSNSGVTCGEFGQAEALAQKKSEIEGWRNDLREKVRIFVAEYIHTLEQWIADECRSAEESIALRKLDYGEDTGGSE